MIMIMIMNWKMMVIMKSCFFKVLFLTLSFYFGSFTLWSFQEAKAYVSQMRVDSAKVKTNSLREMEKIDFFGDLRFRKQYDRDPGKSEKKNLMQFRYRLRVGAKFEFDSHWEVGLRFRSKASDIRSPDKNFDILDDSVDFGLDRFYAKYTVFQGEDVPLNFSIKKGRFQMPLWLQSGAFWDFDVQVEGLGFHVPFLRKFDYQLGYFIMRREGYVSQFLNLEDFFLVKQLKFKHKFETFKVTSALTYGYMSDGDEETPIALVDGQSKAFKTSHFFMGSLQGKYLGGPVKFSLGADFLKSSVDNGDKKNSNGYVGFIGGKYKRWSLKLSYFSIGDASAPFIGGGKLVEVLEGDTTTNAANGEFFTQSSFRSTKSGGNIGFNGFRPQVKFTLSDRVNFALLMFTFKPKETNKFKIAQMEHNKTTYRYHVNMNIKF